MARILVIDDDADVHPLLRVTLTRLGYEPDLTVRADDGLARAASQAYDLVLLDLMMPDLDGFEVARRLRADPATRDVPILVLTARSQLADEDAALEAGADDYLAKPIEADVLGARIAKLLDLAAERRAVKAEMAETASNSGRVCVFLGLRGGAGSTTLAVNLAGAIVQSGRRVCLLELSPSGGQAALHLRLRSVRSWAALDSMPDSSTVAQSVLRHESGLCLLAAPDVPVRRGLAASVFAGLMDVLRTFFAYVIVDAAPSLDEATTCALDLAQRIVVVCNPEVGAVQTTVGTLQAIGAAQRPAGQVHVALNHVAPEDDLPDAAVEKALGRQPELSIPYDRLQPAALRQGVPLIFSNPAAALPSAVGPYALQLLEQTHWPAAA